MYIALQIQDVGYAKKHDMIFAILEFNHCLKCVESPCEKMKLNAHATPKGTYQTTNSGSLFITSFFIRFRDE